MIIVQIYISKILLQEILTKYLFLLFPFGGLLCLKSSAQTAQKPSASYTREKTEVKTEIASLSVIKKKGDFDQLARVYNKGTINEIPHLLFAIDRNNKNRIYYINTPKYEFHLNFINEQLVRNYTPFDIRSNYLDSTRRFVFGTIAFQNLIKKYTYEFWEGDRITPDILVCAQKAITGSFADPIIFKTNSTLHEYAAKALSIAYVTQEQLVKEYAYIALNAGNTKGRIRIADSLEGVKDIADYDILVLKEVPIAIPAVAGVITERASTLLSHVNILARGLKIPSIYLKDATAEMQAYDGKFVELKADMNGYKIKEIVEPLIMKSKKGRYAIKSDTRRSDLIPLDKMRAGDYIYGGTKAANLGEIKSRLKQAIIPDGFSIPFAHYHTFMKCNGIYKRLKTIQNLPGFYQQADVRRNGLAKLRDEIEAAGVDSTMVNEWMRQWSAQLRRKSVFVRSSSNAEDLKNFSGAGLFTSVPNIMTAEELEKAIKKVWASVYNFEAYESRRQAGVPDSLILMGVLVQLAVDPDISGVMITKDPYNPLRQDVVYIAAKRGIGIKVVEGKRIVMYSERTKAVQLISRSEETTELRLDMQGGVKEVPVTNPDRVMTDELIIGLAEYAKKIKQLFNSDIDIEWAVVGGQIIILQARPYK